MKYIFLLLLLSGCATDTAILRITEYKAGTLTNTLGGIAVEQTPGKPFANVVIQYKGDKGTVVIDSRIQE